MKQKDIALVAVMVVLGAVVSLVVSRLIFSAPGSRQQSAEVVDVISPTFNTPPTKYFNSSAVDPTQPIPIGSNNSQ